MESFGARLYILKGKPGIGKSSLAKILDSKHTTYFSIWNQEAILRSLATGTKVVFCETDSVSEYDLDFVLPILSELPDPKEFRIEIDGFNINFRIRNVSIFLITSKLKNIPKEIREHPSTRVLSMK